MGVDQSTGQARTPPVRAPAAKLAGLIPGAGRPSPSLRSAFPEGRWWRALPPRRNEVGTAAKQPEAARRLAPPSFRRRIPPLRPRNPLVTNLLARQGRRRIDGGGAGQDFCPVTKIRRARATKATLGASRRLLVRPSLRIGRPHPAARSRLARRDRLDHARNVSNLRSARIGMGAGVPFLRSVPCAESASRPAAQRFCRWEAPVAPKGEEPPRRCRFPSLEACGRSGCARR